jgi:hypothetical protein
MTKAIGYGTANLSINLPKDERLEWGRVAFRAGAKSVGEFWRRMALKGLEAEAIKEKRIELAESALRIRESRRQYYGATLLAIFIVSMLCGEVAVRRCSRSGRGGRRTEEVAV